MALLFCYAALTKLLHYEQSRNEMLNQVFPRTWALILTWLVPSIELILTGLLLFKASIKWALWGATGLLVVLSAYIAIVMSGLFGRVPCSCGGILKDMGYGTHLLFNLSFVAIGSYGIYLNSDRKSTHKQFNPKGRRLGKVE